MCTENVTETIAFREIIAHRAATLLLLAERLKGPCNTKELIAARIERRKKF